MYTNDTGSCIHVFHRAMCSMHCRFGGTNTHRWILFVLVLAVLAIVALTVGLVVVIRDKQTIEKGEYSHKQVEKLTIGIMKISYSSHWFLLSLFEKQCKKSTGIPKWSVINPTLSLKYMLVNADTSSDTSTRTRRLQTRPNILCKFKSFDTVMGAWASLHDEICRLYTCTEKV